MLPRVVILPHDCILGNFTQLTSVPSIGHAGLFRGGCWPRLGEITLAPCEVLFLDEFPEFEQHLLENLRQPLEDKTVTISRAQGTVTFPANFMLIGAMNFCPCGFYSDPIKECTCSATAIVRYQKRISGPLLDRIGIHVEVPRIEYEKLSSDRLGETSSSIRARVEASREIQRAIFSGGPRIRGLRNTKYQQTSCDQR